MYRAKVLIKRRPSILDPQGKAVAGSLHSLGYDEVDDVRLGKYIEVRLSESDLAKAETRIQEMCRSLLANEVIEDFRFEIEEHSA